MPYSEAFTARNPIYGGEVIFRPKYDTQQEIYYAILEDLKTAAEYFKTSPQTDATFNRQDIIYGGNTDGWYKFANSLRLRYAMRISNVDEAKAREVIASLSSEDLIISNEDNAYIKIQGQSYAPDGGMWRTMNESHSRGQGYYLFAPELMVNIQKEAEDPRMQVFFQPPTDDDGDIIEAYKDSEIIGYPSSADAAIALVTNLGTDEIMNTYAVYNSTTFRKNYYLPLGVGITAAEVYFLLAEAAFRGLSNGNAADLYHKGIVASVQNYYDYYVNSTADFVDSEIAKTDVSDATLSEWLSNSIYRFNSANALEQIATQKWMHLGILQIYENWAEYRRTDFPVLDDDRENGALLNKSEAPVRFMYPAKESSMNTENYNAQSQYNDPHVCLWWDVK